MPAGAITTQLTIPNRRQSIPHSNLPLISRDTITITWKLGSRYLWIDSICIIQHLTADWEVEAFLMDSVYGSSFFQLVAAASYNSSGGCRTATKKNIYGIDSRSIASFERHGKLAVYVPDHSNGFSISMDGSAQYLWYSSLRLVVS